MIITRIDGGLGNQMFQLAYGKYLAKLHHTELRMDISSYAAAPQHGYLLNRYATTAQVATSQQLRSIPRRYRLDGRLQLRDLIPAGWLPASELRRHKESPFGFHPRHLAVGNHRYLVGYWQSEKYFPGMRGELLQEFQLLEPLSVVSRRVEERLRDCRSVAVHVRRGDYVSSASAAQIYCHLEIDYYRQAVLDWAQQHPGIQVFVFSNDIPWCRQNLQLPFPTHYVEHNSASAAHEDLELMRQANCCVIANSTFSWWGAWLNERKDKVVYAPSRWFHTGTLDGSSIVPDHWKRVNEMHRRSAA